MRGDKEGLSVPSKVSGEENICVVGLGYVGLPTAIAFYEAGFKVTGVDVSERVISELKAGRSPLIDSSSDLSIPSDSVRWHVTDDFSKAIPTSDVVLITVPTPVRKDKTPDLSFVENASRNILENIDKEKMTVIVLESTVYPGVTREIIGGLCEKMGISTVKDVTLAYCPERVNPGDFERGIDSVAQIVGCDDRDWGEWLTQLFGRISQEGSTYVGKIEVAEASKLIENVQRDIDIALANELAMVLPKIGVDVEEVLAAASTKWNFHRHTPGIGVGGHCIPVDPYYYIEMSQNVGFPSLLASASRKINNLMPQNTADEIISIMEKFGGKRVLILGFSYKANVGDVRETPVEPLANHLRKNGYEIFIHDPLVEERDLPIWARSNEDYGELDLIVLATNHQHYNFSNSNFWDSMGEKMSKARIYDGRRSLPKDELEKSGWDYYAVGLPEK